MLFSRALFASLRPRIQIDILSKPDCSLCDKAEWAIARLLQNMSAQHGGSVDLLLKKVNIEEHPELLDEFSLTIPVVRVDGQTVLESVIDIPQLRVKIEGKLEKFRHYLIR